MYMAACMQELIHEVEANRLRLAQEFYGFLNRIKGVDHEKEQRGTCKDRC